VAAAETLASLRPQIAAIFARSPTSKKLFTVRQACECDPPMNA